MRWGVEAPGRLLGFERRVALRFLLEGRVQSLLMVVGVAAGVAVVAYISALISGLQSNTLSRTLGAQAHVSVRALRETVASTIEPGDDVVRIGQVQPRSQRLRTLADGAAMLGLLAREPGFIAVSPMTSGSGLAQRGSATVSIALLGVDVAAYERIVGLRDKLVAGAMRLGPGEAIVGTELASDLGVRVGDRIGVLTVPAGAAGAAGAATGGAASATSQPVADSLRITGLVDMGVRDLNRRTVLVPLRSAQSLLGLPGGITSIDLKLADPWQAGDVARRLAARLPYEIESWQQANAQLVSALHAQRVSTALIRIVVMIVVVLGIASVLVVSVVQKRREIGILRAMGATRGQVLRVFLLQGLLVGAAGSVAGVALAALLVKLFVTFVRGSDGRPLFSIALEPRMAMAIALIATVCGVVAAIAPARRAARLDPAQAIRL